MKNLLSLFTILLLVLLVGLGCKNLSFAGKNTNIETPTPSTNSSVYPTPDSISAGTLNQQATVLPKPVYPSAAKAVRAGGDVVVQVVVDKSGNVVSAKAVSGHPLLRASAEQAARKAKFKPSEEKLEGTIVYNFAAK